MDRASVIFCGGALAACFGLAAVAYPFAALSNAKVVESSSVVQAEQLGSMNLGDFGEVPVADLVDYYIQNPPAPVLAGAAPKKVRFEGC